MRFWHFLLLTKDVRRRSRDPMKRLSQSRWYLPVLASVLALQFVGSRAISEPYPAFVLPAFGAVPSEENTITCPQIEATLHSGDRIIKKLAVEQLLPPLEGAFAHQILYAAFDISSAGTSDSRRKEEILRQLALNVRGHCSEGVQCRLALKWKLLTLDVRTAQILDEQIVRTDQQRL